MTTNGNGNGIKVLDHQIPILEKLAQDRVKGKTLVVVPSGGGKTWIAAFDSLAAGANNILYITHRREILKQALKIFKDVHAINGGTTGLLMQDEKDFDARILFATNATLSNKDNLDIVSQRQWDYVIIDEFHHVAAPTYNKILERIKGKFLLGLTATPYRYDKQDIMSYVDGNLSYNIDLEMGIRKGILAPFHYNALYDDIDYSDIIWQGNTYKKSDLDKKLLVDKRDTQIVKEFLRLIGKGHPTIAFCVNVKHCQRMVDKFIEYGVSCRKILGTTCLTDRDIRVRDFMDRKYDVLLVRDVFNEGVDLPHVEAVLSLRPTWSKNVFFQQIGRGLRKYPGKTHVTVLDFIGNYNHAFDKLDWLKFAKESDGEMEHRGLKPEYEHDVPYVHFNQRVIDIFEVQKQFTVLPTKMELKVEYFRMKSLLGHQPGAQDFNRHTAKHNHAIKYAVHRFYQAFGSWNKFLKEIGEPILLQRYGKIPKDELIKQYYEEADRIKAIPSHSRFQKKNNPRIRYPAIAYQQTFGSWNAFLKEINEPENLIKKHLTNGYFKLKKELRRIPTSQDIIVNHSRLIKESDIKAHHLYDMTPVPAYIKYFGSYKKFLESIGEISSNKYLRRPKKCQQCQISMPELKTKSRKFCDKCRKIRHENCKRKSR